jgi:hypothetical protein
MDQMMQAANQTGAQAPRAPMSDAKLIAKCDKFRTLEMEYRRLVPLADFKPGEKIDTQMAYAARLDEVGAERVRVGWQIVAMKPRTLAGVIAKAAAITAEIANDRANDLTTALCYALARDAAALEPVR